MLIIFGEMDVASLPMKTTAFATQAGWEDEQL